MPRRRTTRICQRPSGGDELWPIPSRRSTSLRPGPVCSSRSSTSSPEAPAEFRRAVSSRGSPSATGCACRRTGAQQTCRGAPTAGGTSTPPSGSRQDPLMTPTAVLMLVLILRDWQDYRRRAGTRSSRASRSASREGTGGCWHAISTVACRATARPPTCSVGCSTGSSGSAMTHEAPGGRGGTPDLARPPGSNLAGRLRMHSLVRSRPVGRTSTHVQRTEGRTVSHLPTIKAKTGITSRDRATLRDRVARPSGP
jgi:hypothetical protein